MRIFIFLGHEVKDKHVGRMADAYDAAARAAGHEVRRMNIGDMKFDPILHHGYHEIQELEPDLKTFQENVKWCERLVISYPLWWSNMPALLKGLFDRAWLPGFAYRFIWHGLGWRKLLKGRRARILVSGQTPCIGLWALYYAPNKPLGSVILGFAGIRSRITYVSGIDTMKEEKFKRVLNKIGRLGRLGR